MDRQFEKKSTELCRLLERYGIALFSDISVFRVRGGKILSSFGEADEKRLRILEEAEKPSAGCRYFAVYTPLTYYAEKNEEGLVAVGGVSVGALENAVFEHERKTRTAEKSRRMITELKESVKNKIRHTVEKHEALSGGSKKYYR
ncbi:MAG: hypothetical protein MJ096_00235 [Clostridia bacterium]|nr:hypothetical protein [Clostridia bacterium]